MQDIHAIEIVINNNNNNNNNNNKSIQGLHLKEQRNINKQHSNRQKKIGNRK